MMASQTRTIKATCLCGAAEYQITLPASDFPLKAHFCHCNSCRHVTGTLSLTIVCMPKGYKPPESIVGKLTPYQFSTRIIQYHCPTCGTHMVERTIEGGDDSSSPPTWDLYTGTLEQADGVFEIEGHMFIADTRDGGFSDLLPSINTKTLERWPHHPYKEEQVPLYWRAEDRVTTMPSPRDKLHAHCKCGGVNFWIAQPSERSKLGRRSWPDLLHPSNHPQKRTDEQTWWICGRRYLAGLCSCDSCRLTCGMELVEWAFIPTIDITLDVDGKTPYTPDAFGTLRHYRSSLNAVRGFCEICGAMVFWKRAGRPDVIDVAVGLLDAPEGARAENWLSWSLERLSFREDAMPRRSCIVVAVEEGLKKYSEKMGSVL